MESSKPDDVDKCIETFVTSVLHSNMLIFIKELFRHILKDTEGLEYTSECNGMKHALPTYESKVGEAIKEVLTFQSDDIEKLFNDIKEKIQIREHLKMFITRLGDKFLSVSSTQHELYFLAITSRIFAFAIKAQILSPNVFIEEVVGTMLEHVLGSLYSLAVTKSLPMLNIESSIANILNSKWIDDCRGLRCGDAS